MFTYFQHGRRHHPIRGTDPTEGLGTENVWAICETRGVELAPGTDLGAGLNLVATGFDIFLPTDSPASPADSAFYAIDAGTTPANQLQILQAGTYRFHVWAAVIDGTITAADTNYFQALSFTNVGVFTQFFGFGRDTIPLHGDGSDDSLRTWVIGTGGVYWPADEGGGYLGTNRTGIQIAQASDATLTVDVGLWVERVNETQFDPELIVATGL